MSNKVNQVISNYLKESDLQLEALPDLPLPDQADMPMDQPAPMAAPPAAPAKEEPEVVAGPDLVSAVKTMIELLSYGLHADEDVLHRDPVAKWLQLRTDDGINEDNAYDILQQINNHLGTEV